jgi:aminopeptidase-like protein
MNPDLEKYFDRLWPICRSITGNGLRESFKILQEIIPLELEEIPTGTKVFDWEIPKEWNITDAYIITPEGKKICNFKESNLHILNYSVSQNTELTFEELRNHLIYREDLPEAIPYATSYYKENWGFCISYNKFKTLPKEGKYKVVIDSTLKTGSLTYGQLVLKGKSDKEILLSTYLCHPSMANNELSGPLALAALYTKIAGLKDRKYTYRFVIAPETIGVIAFLHKYGKDLINNLEAGYVLTCCADRGNITYKKSKKENTLADRAAERVLKSLSQPSEIIPYAIGGSDERQYCSPGFNLPVGSFIRTPYQKYKEYHTSLDNKGFISFEKLNETVDTVFKVIKTIEQSKFYINTNPFCEPQLGKRNLYPAIGGTWGDVQSVHKMLHLLSYADGTMDITDIAAKRNLTASDFTEAIAKLTEVGLLKEK